MNETTLLITGGVVIALLVWLYISFLDPMEVDTEEKGQIEEELQNETPEEREKELWKEAEREREENEELRETYSHE